MKVPLCDLKRQYQQIKYKIDNAVHSVLDSGQFILGENVSKFEEEFARYCGTRYCVAVGSGTDALKLAVRAVRQGGYGLAPANCFIAAVDALYYNGYHVRLSDIDPDYYTMQIKEKGIWECVIPVHLYGQSADIDRIKAMVEGPIIEDCAQAVGATYKGRKVGSLGIAGCFSFFPAKNLGAYGDAGAIVTNRKWFYQKLKLLRFFGWKKNVVLAGKNDDHTLIGYNSKMDELQAAVLRVKLPYLDRWNTSRIKNALIYKALLNSVPEVKLPLFSNWRKPVFSLFVVRCEKRDELRNFLAKKGIQTGIHYAKPIHLTKAYKEIILQQKGDLPIAEKCAGEILSLPMFPELTEEEIHYVVDSIKEFYRSRV